MIVHPIFETSAYPASLIEAMYTSQEELRANKLRNRREFAYERHDWRNAVEEEEMEDSDEERGGGDDASGASCGREAKGGESV